MSVDELANEVLINTKRVINKTSGASFSEAHEKELKTLCDTLATCVFNDEGLKAVCEMQTGMGKTTALEQWLLASYGRGFDFPVLVTVPTIKAMESMVQHLSGMGEAVGYVHAERESKKLPSPTNITHRKEKRVLVCCNVRMDEDRNDLADMLEYKDGRQRMVVHDETPTFGTSCSSQWSQLESGWVLVKGRLDAEHRKGLEEMFSELGSEVKDLPPHTAKKWRYDLPEGITKALKPEAEKTFREDKKRNGHALSLCWLVDALKEGVRVERVDDGGVAVSYERTWPNIKKLVVLDASYPHSTLSALDTSIGRLGLGKAKRYNHVKMKVYKRLDGKDSVYKNKAATNAWLKGIEKEGGEVLLITYKELSLDKGKDTSCVTWGKHTSLNEYSSIDTVAVVGLNRMKPEQALAKGALIADDLMVNRDVKWVENQAMCDLYQAINRAKCRGVSVDEYGHSQALLTNVHLYGKLSDDQKEMLKEMMPGIDIDDADEEMEHFVLKASRVDTSISKTKLKEAIGFSGSRWDWEEKLMPALEETGWTFNQWNAYPPVSLTA